MIGLDITTNENYVQGDMEVWGITALQVYDYSLSYNTLIDEKWTANEQRRAKWTNPRRVWTLEFKKTPEGGRKFEEFFKLCKGRFKAFKFKWSNYYSDSYDMGGDNEWYYVRLVMKKNVFILVALLLGLNPFFTSVTLRVLRSV